MRTVLLLLLVLCAPRIASAVDLKEAEARLQRALHVALPASVAVSDDQGTFSAVIVESAGIVLTAGHCVTPGRNYKVQLSDGRELSAVGLGRERRLDIGMLRFSTHAGDERIPAVELARSNELQVGDFCFGVSHPGIADPQRGPVIRVGQVLETLNAEGYIKTSVAMEPGDSGGPLFDLSGRVIGIHSQIDTLLSENFDVPIDAFVRHWDQLLAGKSFVAWKSALNAAGLETEDVDNESAGKLAGDVAGARITSIVEKGAAAKSGLQVGDRVLRVNDSDVADAKAFRRALRRSARADLTEVVRLALLRGSQAVEVEFRFPTGGAQARPVVHSPEGTDFPELDGVEAVGASTVTVKSSIDGTESEVLGAVVSQDGLVLSKSSRVGQTLRVVDVQGESYNATIVGRDKENDLVLLRAARFRAEAGHFVDLGSTLPPILGRLVRYPVADPLGAVGVVGTIQHSVSADLVFGIRVSYDSGEARVTYVFPDSPAETGGLQSGDVLCAIDTSPVTTDRGVAELLGAMAAPRPVEVEIRRLDKRQKLVVVPEPRGQEQMGMGHVADRVPGGLSERRIGFPTVFAVDCLVRPEQCGAPILDLQGGCVGMLIARHSRTQSLAVPPRVLKEFVKQALASEQAPRKRITL